MTQNHLFPYTLYNVGSTALYIAVENGHLKNVSELLSNGVDVNSAYKSRYGKTPLHVAAQKGNEEIAKLLLNRGAKVCSKSDNGETPLHIATKYRHLHIAEHLLNHGADVNSLSVFPFSCTPLHIAVRNSDEGITKLLLSRGADVNFVFSTKSSCDVHYTLLFPIYNTDKEIKKLFLNGDADGACALHIAIDNGHFQIVQLLLKYGADVNYVSSNWYRGNFTPLQLAVEKGDDKITKLLLNGGAHIHMSIYDAIENGHLQIVEHLLNHGGDVYSPNEKTLYPAVLSGHVEIVNLFLSRGAHAGGVLHTAATLGYMQIVQSLLIQGANVNSVYTGVFGTKSTPLVSIISRYTDVVKLLVVYGARVNAERAALCFTNIEQQKVLESCLESAKAIVSEKECMRRAKIGNSKVSFCDILTVSVNQLAMYMMNENIVQILKSDHYKTEFPIYASMINCRFKKAMERRVLLEQSTRHFYFAFKNFQDLPQICIAKVLSFLSDKDLEVLVDACK